jgi:hypothetical protein
MRWAACFIGSAERGRSLKITSRLESALNLPLEALLALIPEGILLIDAKRGVSAFWPSNPFTTGEPGDLGAIVQPETG